jgi:hypothetical protein
MRFLSLSVLLFATTGLVNAEHQPGHQQPPQSQQAQVQQSPPVSGSFSPQGPFPKAPEVKNNPQGVVYAVDFSNQPNTNVRGKVYAQAISSGDAIKFRFNISGFKGQKGPFSYHIHVNQVSSDGNCTSTGPHQDVAIRGMSPPCNSDEPATCESGDLAGKHGKIPAPGPNQSIIFHKTFVDKYVSTDPKNPAFFGNQSLVFHLGDEKKTRYACANFELVVDTTKSKSIENSVLSAVNSTMGATNDTSSSSDTKGSVGSNIGLQMGLLVMGLVVGFAVVV